MKSFDKNFHYVDLEGFNSAQIFNVCAKYNILPDELYKFIRKKYTEFWILKEDKFDGRIVSYAKDGIMEMNSDFKDFLLTIGSKKSTFNKEKLPVILEVDSILEKISKYGISSITDEEKKFLDESNL